MSGHEIMLRFGYHHLLDRRSGKDSYSKRLFREHYPRFHVYLKDKGEQLTFSLHLDQKQASYAGSHMHSGEYDGPLVEQEISALKRFIVTQVQAEFDGRKLNEEGGKIETKKSRWKFW